MSTCTQVILPSVNVSAFQVTKNGTIGKLFTCGQENQGFVSSPLFAVRVARWVPVRSPRRTPARCISSLTVHGDPLQAPICFLVLLTSQIFPPNLLHLHPLHHLCLSSVSFCFLLKDGGVVVLFSWFSLRRLFVKLWVLQLRLPPSFCSFRPPDFSRLGSF